MDEVIFDKVQNVFRQVFQNPALHIEPAYTAQDIAHWDSLTHMTLIAALEEFFSITFTFEEVTAFNNINDIVNLISKKTS